MQDLRPLMTANNHAIDRGAKWSERTIKQLNKYGLHQTGTFISQEDKDSLRIFQVNGIKIAMLAYAEHTNGVPIPKGKSYLINLINEELIAEDILKARQKGSRSSSWYIFITDLEYRQGAKQLPARSCKQNH